MTLADGQQLAKSLVKQFWQMLQKDPIVHKHIEFYQKRGIPNANGIALERAAFRIGFWDAEVNRPKAPFLAEILYLNRVIYYYEADPITQEIHLVYKEDYDENAISAEKITE
jgi:hypothetical protein